MLINVSNNINTLVMINIVLCFLCFLPPNVVMVVEVALGIRLEPVFATAALSFALLQPVGDGVC